MHPPAPTRYNLGKHRSSLETRRVSLTFFRSLAIILTLGSLTVPASNTARSQTAPSSAIPPHASAIVLFDGHDLAGFDIFIRNRGLNTDPNHIFSVEHGLIHVSGHEFGYLVTKRSFHRFYLRADFKWGEGTFAERAGQARDSGILYSIQGPDKVWPRSVEFQIKEGETGDFWMTDGAAVTGPDGVRVTGPPNSALNIGHRGKGPTQNTLGFRNSSGELENPHGQWNTLELIVDDKIIHQYVNGKLANVGTDPTPTEGRILFQSEGAEIYFRNLVLYPLR